MTTNTTIVVHPGDGAGLDTYEVEATDYDDQKEWARAKLRGYGSRACAYWLYKESDGEQYVGSVALYGADNHPTSAVLDMLGAS